MCTNIGVNLPTVVSFLLLYSLRCGCIIILVWTSIRATFFLGFFVVSMMEVFLPRPPLLGAMFAVKPVPPTSDEYYFFVFMAYLILIVSECILAMYLIYLGIGLYYETPGRIEQYLVCRFLTWSVEVLFLVVLCVTHDSLIGWYLGFLMVIILEFYGFIVVYSYYVDMIEEYKGDHINDASMEEFQQAKPPYNCPC